LTFSLAFSRRCLPAHVAVTSYFSTGSGLLPHQLDPVRLFQDVHKAPGHAVHNRFRLIIGDSVNAGRWCKDTVRNSGGGIDFGGGGDTDRPLGRAILFLRPAGRGPFFCLPKRKGPKKRAPREGAGAAGSFAARRAARELALRAQTARAA
jgi:hypothetical protein